MSTYIWELNLKEPVPTAAVMERVPRAVPAQKFLLHPARHLKFGLWRWSWPPLPTTQSLQFHSYHGNISVGHKWKPWGSYHSLSNPENHWGAPWRRCPGRHFQTGGGAGGLQGWREGAKRDNNDNQSPSVAPEAPALPCPPFQPHSAIILPLAFISWAHHPVSCRRAPTAVTPGILFPKTFSSCFPPVPISPPLRGPPWSPNLKSTLAPRPPQHALLYHSGIFSF